jgi:cytosine/adenosine deaminase-related metal-dependent hydrolase
MRLATLLHKPKFGVATIDAQKALDLATRDGAKALHWFDKVGSIEVGKSADFIMLDAIDPSTVPAPKFPLTKENQVRATGKTLRGPLNPTGTGYLHLFTRVMVGLSRKLG